MLLQALAICVAACLGALMRWGMQLWLNPGGWLPWGTLAVNLIGGLLVGIAIATFDAFADLSPAWRPAVITGFLGALTTFSSFSAEVVGMLMAGRVDMALASIGLHLGGSLLMTWVGLRGAQMLLQA
jgi:fluoride exporter